MPAFDQIVILTGKKGYREILETPTVGSKSADESSKTRENGPFHTLVERFAVRGCLNTMLFSV